MTDTTNDLRASLKDDHINRTVKQHREPNTVSMEIISITNISPTVKHLVLLTREKPIPFTFKAGQWFESTNLINRNKITETNKMTMFSGSIRSYRVWRLLVDFLFVRVRFISVKLVNCLYVLKIRIIHLQIGSIIK